MDIFHKAEEMGCIVLTHYTNLGKGRALKTAFNYCLSLSEDGYKGVMTVDADGQHKLTDIIAISKALEKEPESLILGARNFSGKDIPFRSKFGNTMTKYVFQMFCGIRITDTQTGLRGIPFSMLDMLCHVDGEKYEYETNVLLKCREENVEIKEIPIETIYENDNSSSHFHPVRDSLRIYRTIFKYIFSSLLAAVIDFALFGILIDHRIDILPATYMARLCSMLVNFAINKRVVFKAGGDVKRQFAKYVILVVISGTLSGLIVAAATKYLAPLPILYKALAETLLYFINYYVQQTYIFTGKSRNHFLNADTRRKGR